MHLDRPAAHAALVRARRSCRACPGLINPADCDGGVHDSEHIGPWTLWQGNLRTDLLVVGQDWGDTRYFIANGGHDARRNPTNENLRGLLRSIGIEIPLPTPVDAGGRRHLPDERDSVLEGRRDAGKGAAGVVRELRRALPAADHRHHRAEGRGNARRMGVPGDYGRVWSAPHSVQEGRGAVGGVPAGRRHHLRSRLPLRRAYLEHAPADGAATEGLGTGGKGVAVLTVPYVRSRGCSPSRPSTNRYTLRHSVPLHQVIMSPPLCSLPRYTNACVSPIQAISISRPFRR